MLDAAYGLWRTPLLGTSVNRLWAGTPTRTGLPRRSRCPQGPLLPRLGRQAWGKPLAPETRRRVLAPRIRHPRDPPRACPSHRLPLRRPLGCARPPQALRGDHLPGSEPHSPPREFATGPTRARRAGPRARPGPPPSPGARWLGDVIHGYGHRAFGPEGRLAGEHLVEDHS